MDQTDRIRWDVSPLLYPEFQFAVLHYHIQELNYDRSYSFVIVTLRILYTYFGFSSHSVSIRLFRSALAYSAYPLSRP